MLVYQRVLHLLSFQNETSRSACFHRAAEEGWKLSSGSKKERQDNNGHVGKKTHVFLVNHILHIKKKCITCVCVSNCMYVLD